MPEVTAAELPASPAHGELRLVENALQRHAWLVKLDTDRIYFDPGDQRPKLAFDRAELARDAELVLGAFMRVLLLKKPKTVALRMEKEDLGRMRAWLLPTLGEHMKKALKRQLRLSLPIGALIVLTSLPILTPSGANVPPMDPFLLAYGFGLLAVGAASLLRPHSILFIADSIVWILLATANIRHALETNSTLSWVVFVLCLHLSARAFSLWRFYAAPR